MRHLGLVLFFLILSERLSLEAVLIGIGLSVLAVKLCSPSRDEQTAPPLYSLRCWPFWIAFAFILIKEITHANLQVAWILLSRNMNIDPKVYLYHTRLKDKRLIVLLSTAITLTPGTMTVDLKGEQLAIHALRESYYFGLSKSSIEAVLMKWEAKLYG
jgi:multicomponent Na+:H+ antiporter subunit E